MKRLLSIVLALVLCTSVSLTAYAAEDKGVLSSGVSYSNIEAVIDSYVEDHKDTTAAVSVAVFTDSNVLMEKAYGYSDIENAISNDKDTVFEWGSCTKLLVWTSVMQLVEKGKIDLKEDIRTYLPEGFFKKLKFDTPITILNLMNHNAGWQETVTDLFIKDKKDVKELGEALQLIEPEQVHEPGTVVAYSNWGSALAGYIVERISGQSFHDYVHEHIFESLGMKHTALNATLSDNKWVAEKRKEEKCYTTKNESLGTRLYYLSLYPAGMATGTISDFIKFGQTFLVAKGEKSPLFEKRETLDEMLSPSLFFADGKAARNYHGFWTDELGVSVLWHNGGTLGSSSWFAFDLKSGTGMIILTNQAGESIYNCGLLPKVFGKYESGTGIVQPEDISGMYVSSRTCFKGFAKPYSLVSLMRLVSKDGGLYSVPGTHKTVAPIKTGSYLMDDGGLKQFIIYASTDKDGRTVLQLPASDYVEVNGYGVIAKYALLVLFVLATVYGFFSLIISFIGFLKRKKSIGTIGKCRAIVNASVITTAMMFVYISIKLFSGLALLEDVLWSVILNGVFALIPVAYAVILATKWKKLHCTRKEKINLIMTGIAGFIMTINVIFWEAYKFW
ncbi:serine hydrolase domain-containing protein [Desnuesiella massiliensis]|uniref:serine hydrolase domain-containing protein n=1 Tax=Desnuesiella massiliensis TaxID=1650662 RepID=UPI0006E20033|nr:serine hydrolase domain-containing protein [Desnuesiella massiliensis]